MSASDAPAVLAMRALCSKMISAPVTDVPAINTMNAMSSDCDAAIGATIPPSLWPIRPIRAGWMSLRFLSRSTAAMTSAAKSSLVACDTDPVDPPTPRSS